MLYLPMETLAVAPTWVETNGRIALILGKSRLYLTKKSDDWTLVVITDIGGRAYTLESLTLDEAKKASTDKLREIVSKLNQDLALLPKT
jgi:hypothetical protein